MYVTRRLSELLKNPKSLSKPPDGPNSGYLVIKDEETQQSYCMGLFKRTTNKVHKMPIPQNMDLTLTLKEAYNTYQSYCVPIFFIPVLNQPLSSNTYYAIYPQGKHKGKALLSSRENNTLLLPTPLNPQNVYQQVKIFCHHRKLDTRSVASDGFRPHFLPDKPCSAQTSTPFHFELHEALGIDSTLRRLPSFNFPLTCKSSIPVIVGKWYVPFMFVKEGRHRDQMERSMYYHVTLEQRWEKIFTCKKNIDDNDVKGNLAKIDVTVELQEVFIVGYKARWSEKNADDGVIWYTSYETGSEILRVGLRVEVVKRMKWEQKRGGWKGTGKELKGRVKQVEEFKEDGDWKEFGCYVLVERFNLRRMDGSLAMAYDFKHIHQIMTLWE